MQADLIQGDYKIPCSLLEVLQIQLEITKLMSCGQHHSTLLLPGGLPDDSASEGCEVMPQLATCEAMPKGQSCRALIDSKCLDQHEGSVCRRRCKRSCMILLSL